MGVGDRQGLGLRGHKQDPGRGWPLARAPARVTNPASCLGSGEPHPRGCVQGGFGRCPPRCSPRPYLRHDDEPAALGIHGLHDPRHGAVAHGEASHQPGAAHQRHALVADGEEDVGLRLGAALRGDLEGEEQRPSARPPAGPRLTLGGTGANTPALSTARSEAPGRGHGQSPLWPRVGVGRGRGLWFLPASWPR